ncbi:MAG: hypothetical protein ACK5JM_14160 [Rhodoblastus sp.]
MAYLGPLALILVSLVTRAIFDKLLALSPDMALVAHWAQAQSLFDLTTAVALAGVGAGLTVFAARRGYDDTQLMRDALVWGLLIAGGAALALAVFSPVLNMLVGREVAPSGVVGLLAIGGGLMFTTPGLFVAFWQGRLERGKMLAAGLFTWAAPALAASGLFGPADMTVLLAVQLATLTVLAFFLVAPLARQIRARGAGLASWRNSPLKRYIPAGLSIGILSPFSIMWSRAELAHGLSWDEAAQLQALWRASEWVTGLAGGLIPLVFLPRMAAAADRAEFLRELVRTWRILCIPGALSIAVLWAGQGAIMPLLYSEKFLMPALASGLFLAGDALRLACWVPLHGLFATERIKAVAIGEWLSLPLFAALLTASGAHSLVIAGACYAVAYAIYLSFNVWSIYRTPGRYATAPS